MIMLFELFLLYVGTREIPCIGDLRLMSSKQVAEMLTEMQVSEKTVTILLENDVSGQVLAFFLC